MGGRDLIISKTENKMAEMTAKCACQEETKKTKGP